MAKRSCLPVSAVNHISLLCSSVEESVAFYEDVLGFIPIKRPGSFDFDGAWLFNYGMGIHLIQAAEPSELGPKKAEINPKDNHLSFQTACQRIEDVEEHLEALGVKYKKVQVEEKGIQVDQIFFHDPDGFMVEVCTCDNLPLIPLEEDEHHRHSHHASITTTTTTTNTNTNANTNTNTNTNTSATASASASCSRQLWHQRPSASTCAPSGPCSLPSNV